MSEASATRCGFVALIGAPNAGKSTLINKLVGAKVAIVSHKVQTTRATVRGIVMAGSAQIVFVDTPGIFRPKRRLERAMVETAWGGARDADIVALLIDAAGGLTDEARSLLAGLGDVGRLLAASRGLEHLERQLDGRGFLRVHRRFLVNLGRIREIEPGFKGALFVTTDPHTHETVPVARRHAPELRQALGM